MGYFTHLYKQVTVVNGLPVRIIMEDSRRWICYQFCVSYGKRYEITLIDNYLEIYRIYWNGPGTIELVANDISIELYYTDNRVDHMYLKNRNNNLNNLPLPDFAIDVLETVENNTSFEIISRIVKAFYAKSV
jgi:hypothetical protein